MAAPRERYAAPQRADRPDVVGPTPALSAGDAIALIVGLVVGAGIFRTPSLVAANVDSGRMMLLAWLLGGAVSLAGALCYAELATTYPHAGGEYHYLRRAYGGRLAFLFAWARISVIQTGSIAYLTFVFGDYAANLFPALFGTFSSSVYAALAIVVLTALNIIGIRLGARTQNVLTAIEVLGVLVLVVAGLTLDPATAAPAEASRTPAFGLVMVFVLLTYGGWNEAAYLGAEVRGSRRTIAGALIASMAIITLLYLLANVAYLRGLGLAGMANSTAVAADLMTRAAGDGGARLISVLIAISALTSANATIFTGARTNYAVGRDFAPFAALGRWNARARTPTNALVVQGVIALALVAFGSLTRDGFQTMVEYTAPVFWLFFLLTVASLFVLRTKEPDAVRPFRVPGYPVTPLLFCATSAYLLYSSLAYTRVGALVGVAVLAMGGVVLLVSHRRSGDVPASPGASPAP